MKLFSSFQVFKTKQGKLCALFFMLGSCATGCLVALACLLLVQHYRRAESKPGQRLAALAAQVQPANNSPWGTIEAVEIPFANPDGAFPDEEKRLQQPKWFFENASEGRLTRFFNSCDLLPAQRKILLDKKIWNITTNGIEISPPEILVWSLNSQARRQIYSVLSKSLANYSQCFPFRFSAGGFEHLLSERKLTVQNMDKILRLSYTNSANSGRICFTDLHTAREVLTPDGFEDLTETLYEIPAFSLRLHVTPDTNVKALVNYWGKGAREKRIKPLLTALSKVRGGSAINVSYLLPPFARLRLYTYPDAWDDPTASSQDCFFTSMNFFNASPDTNLFDFVYAQKLLQEEYVAIDEEPAFGDVISLLDPSGKAIHMCVYIAADFVFTKNGMNPAQPWVLMRMSDMLMTYYGPRNKGSMMVLRRRDTFPSRECSALAVSGRSNLLQSRAPTSPTSGAPQK
ncbi:MAG TPA: hypothetical protein VFA77_09365 [Candidatus Eisenbacteria bacterium]|nr:hypothetical protein [Candidatus Eisenbacteria bacterium]